MDSDDINDVQEYGAGALDASAAVLAAVPASGSGSGGSPDTGGSLAEMYAEGRR